MLPRESVRTSSARRTMFQSMLAMEDVVYAVVPVALLADAADKSYFGLNCIIYSTFNRH